MIIFGTRGVTTTPEKGVFHCPRCGPGSAFHWKRVRRFFTLYFIPVIPLDMVGEYVQCQQCKGTYETRVLDYNPASEGLKLQGEFHQLIRLVMIASLPDTLRLERPALVRLAELHESMGHPGVDVGRWERDAAEFSQAGGNFVARLKAMSASVSDHGRETLLEAGYAAASEFNRAGEAHLGDLAGALGMTPSHFHGVMKTLESAGRLPAPEVSAPALPDATAPSLNS